MYSSEEVLYAQIQELNKNIYELIKVTSANTENIEHLEQSVATLAVNVCEIKNELGKRDKASIKFWQSGFVKLLGASLSGGGIATLLNFLLG